MTEPPTSKLLCTPWDTAESHRVLFRPDVGCPYCEISHQANEIERLTAALAAKTPVCYSTSYCDKHRNMSWTATMTASAPAIKLVCPLCEPPR